MDGNKHNVVVLIYKFNDFVHTPLIVLHPHESAEYSHTVVDVNDVVPYRKRCQVIDCQLLTLLHCATKTYPVKAVENLVVRVDADLVFIVDEPAVDCA